MVNNVGISGILKKRYHLCILFLLTISQLVMSLGAYAWGPLAPFLRAEFAITRAQTGAIVSALYAVSVIIAMPSGVTVDRLGAKVTLIFALVIMGSPFCALSLVDSFTIFVVIASLTGIGYGMINQISSKGIMRWFEKKNRATAMGIKQTGVTLGGAIGAIMIPAISLSLNWRWATMVIGVTILITALGVIFFYREYPAEINANESVSVSKTTEERPKHWQKDFSLILRKPELIILCFVGMLLAASQTSIASFLVLYMVEELKVSTLAAGICLSVFMIAGTVGRVMWGIISDKIFNSDRQYPMIYLCLIAFGSAIGMVLLQPASSTWLLYCLSAVLGFSFMGWNSLFITAGAELAGSSLVGLVTGLTITVAWTGIIAGPPLFGIIADKVGYSWSWLVLAAFGLICSGTVFYSIKASPDNRVKEADSAI
jgi:MFS transporter, ACS family, hexuronate transporter